MTNTSMTTDGPEPLITGEVTSIEAEYDTLGTRAVVRGYDKSHRLAAGRKTATFQNANYSDIAQQIAGDAGPPGGRRHLDGTLRARVPGQPVGPRLPVRRSPARSASTAAWTATRCCSRSRSNPPAAPAEGDLDSSEPVQLVWGESLLEFRARMSAVAQVAKVEVRGWDPGGQAGGHRQGRCHRHQRRADHLSPPTSRTRSAGKTLVVVHHAVTPSRPRTSWPRLGPSRSAAQRSRRPPSRSASRRSRRARPSASPASTRPLRQVGDLRAPATSSARGRTVRRWSSRDARTARSWASSARGRRGPRNGCPAW